MSDSVHRFDANSLSSDSEPSEELQDYLQNDPHEANNMEDLEDVHLHDASGEKAPPSAFSFVHVFLLPFIVLSAVQGTLAIFTGPHYVGLGVSFVVLIFIVIFIVADKKNYKAHLALKILWWIGMALIVFLCLLFLACYTITFSQPSLFLGFPPNCNNHPGACVRVMQNASASHRANDVLAPIIKNTTATAVVKSILKWLQIQTYSVSVLEGYDYAHFAVKARFVTPLWGFCDDFYFEIVPSVQPDSEGDFLIQMHSESRWAGGDMDANFKRIDYFVKDFMSRKL